MSDPAVEAAERVKEICRQGRLGIYLGPKGPITTEVASAREALRPVREWCEEWKSALNEENVCAVVALAVLDDLAKLIYSTEELAL